VHFWDLSWSLKRNEIFPKVGGDPVWVGSTESLGDATERIDELASVQTGDPQAIGLESWLARSNSASNRKQEALHNVSDSDPRRSFPRNLWTTPHANPNVSLVLSDSWLWDGLALPAKGEAELWAKSTKVYRCVSDTFRIPAAPGRAA
jgi:hypothetical protein